MDTVETLREKIDQIDNEMLTLLAERFSLVGEIGRYKKKHNIPVINKDREKRKIEALVIKAKTEGISRNFIENVWQAIFAESYRLEK